MKYDKSREECYFNTEEYYAADDVEVRSTVELEAIVLFDLNESGDIIGVEILTTEGTE